MDLGQSIFTEFHTGLCGWSKILSQRKSHFWSSQWITDFNNDSCCVHFVSLKLHSKTTITFNIAAQILATARHPPDVQHRKSGCISFSVGRLKFVLVKLLAKLLKQGPVRHRAAPSIAEPLCYPDLLSESRIQIRGRDIRKPVQENVLVWGRKKKKGEKKEKKGTLNPQS